MDVSIVRQQCVLLYENSAPCGWWLCTAPVSILPSTAAGPSSTRLLICRNSSGSSPPTTVKPKPRRLFFSFVLMKVPFSSAGFLVKKGFPPAQHQRQKQLLPLFPFTYSTFSYQKCLLQHGQLGQFNVCLITHLICMHLVVIADVNYMMDLKATVRTT